MVLSSATADSSIDHISDAADLAVARPVGFDENICEMHSVDKILQWAYGVLTKSSN